ncbi:SpoIIE family protein phosphatase [Actinomadura graeca]|uniref:SpoIIE family protein phosphatase n=1 Tax=Actinomadura graeca TaxID=2750812 RepID=A0ABX8QWH7_9ACTN|nr:fused response regulator/phosphatase [Actinomadura graeca]QXJ23120.1 SpoIIE family protein phosphatase [Actinomadura graeca]
MDTDRATALVVDDTPAKRYIISSWLRRAGHTVIEAGSAAETWLKLAEHDVSLVILDVRLPDMSGIEVCERIKSDPRTAALPVIHISATAIATSDRTYGLQQGADAYLTDPIDPEEFLATTAAVLRYYLARRRAERMAERLASLTRTTLAVNSAETFDQLATAAAVGAAEVFGVAAASFILPVDGRLRRTVCLDPGRPPWPRTSPPDTLRRLGELVPLGEDTGSAVATVAQESLVSVLPDNAADGDVVLVLSRTKSGRPPICIGIQRRDAMSEDETNLLRQLGQTVALAVEALRSYAEEHALALTLQRSLLPTRSPHVPGWRFAVRYEPASDQAEIGGDFYEVLDFGGHVLIAIGDVQGHSLRAATVMAEVRHALRAFADEGHDAETILVRLNSVFERYHDDQSATVCLMTLDPATGDLQIASAGHLPPLFHDGGRSWFGEGGGVLLGFPLSDVRIERTAIPPGGVVALFTDGLIEDRDVPLTDNLERLRLMPLDDDLEKYCDQVLDEFGHREDDVALIVLRRDPA